MATHDYVIDNSTGANVRSDINNVLQAILTNNSSSSAPTNTAAYMWWADTTTGILKIRNSANDGWVELLQLDGTLTLEDGSASTPGLAFRDDLNTGIFSSAADTFNVATAGVERMELGATTIFNEDGADVDFRIEGDSKVNLFYLNAGTDRIGINEDAPSALFHVAGTDGQTVGSISSSLPLLVSKNGNCGVAIIGASDAKSIITLGDPDDADVGMIEYDHSSNNMSFTTSASERMRVDSSGRVLIGTTSARSSGGGVNAHLQLEGTNSQSAEFLITRNSADTFSPILGLVKTRGTSVGSNTTVADNDVLGTIQFRGADGSDIFSVGASVFARVNGTPSDGTDMPAELVFATTADGASSPTERMSIDSSGNVGIGATPSELLHIAKSGTAKLKIEDLRTAISNDSEFATIQFAQKDSNGDGVSFEMAATMTDSSNGSCALAFKNNRPSAFAERMRIDSLFFLHGCTTTTGGASSGVYVQEYLGHVYNAIKIRDTANTGSAQAVVFITGSSEVGSVVQTGSATSYNTSSDYRLKENEEEINDGITRLKLLKPYKFNWKRDPDTRVDGFFAHEAQEVVPEAVTGKKDEIAACDVEGRGITKGQKIYQQMDNAKLIPVLTAAIKEAVSKIEVLETKVAALEAA